jgi:2-polyprenyl-3-methyl-5-hydroxy-6-metoxy-1,4-benzoquinol methylase
MSENVKICPLCGGEQNRVFERWTFRGEGITYCICEGCGMVFQSPRKSAEELAAFYEQEYRQLYQGSEGPNAKDLAVQAGRAEALLKFAGGRLAGVSRHLDIGCSAGLLLQSVQGAYHCESAGVEPGRAYREYALQQGLRVVPSLEDLKNGDEPRFDLISLAHVLEHIPDPVDTLASLRRDLLTESGRLLVEAPNLYAHDSFETAHLVAFSPHTLAQTLQKASFEIEAFQLHGRPRSQLIPLYLTILARPTQEKPSFRIHPERAVHLKRRLGLIHRRLITRLLPKQAWIRVSD